MPVTTLSYQLEVEVRPNPKKFKVHKNDYSSKDAPNSVHHRPQNVPLSLLVEP